MVEVNLVAAIYSTIRWDSNTHFGIKETDATNEKEVRKLYTVIRGSLADKNLGTLPLISLANTCLKKRLRFYREVQPRRICPTGTIHIWNEGTIHLIRINFYPFYLLNTYNYIYTVDYSVSYIQYIQNISIPWYNIARIQRVHNRKGRRRCSIAQK